MIVRKLGTLQEMLKEHGPTRDDVMEWVREQARIETEKYKKEKEARYDGLYAVCTDLLDDDVAPILNC